MNTFFIETSPEIKDKFIDKKYFDVQINNNELMYLDYNLKLWQEDYSKCIQNINNLVDKLPSVTENFNIIVYLNLRNLIEIDPYEQNSDITYRKVLIQSAVCENFYRTLYKKLDEYGRTPNEFLLINEFEDNDAFKQHQKKYFNLEVFKEILKFDDNSNFFKGLSSLKIKWFGEGKTIEDIDKQKEDALKLFKEFPKSDNVFGLKIEAFEDIIINLIIKEFNSTQSEKDNVESIEAVFYKNLSDQIIESYQNNISRGYHVKEIFYRGANLKHVKTQKFIREISHSIYLLDGIYSDTFFDDYNQPKEIYILGKDYNDKKMMSAKSIVRMLYFKRQKIVNKMKMIRQDISQKNGYDKEKEIRLFNDIAALGFDDDGENFAEHNSGEDAPKFEVKLQNSQKKAFGVVTNSIKKIRLEVKSKWRGVHSKLQQIKFFKELDDEKEREDVDDGIEEKRIHDFSKYKSFADAIFNRYAIYKNNLKKGVSRVKDEFKSILNSAHKTINDELDGTGNSEGELTISSLENAYENAYDISARRVIFSSHSRIIEEKNIVEKYKKFCEEIKRAINFKNKLLVRMLIVYIPVLITSILYWVRAGDTLLDYQVSGTFTDYIPLVTAGVFTVVLPIILFFVYYAKMIRKENKLLHEKYIDFVSYVNEVTENNNINKNEYQICINTVYPRMAAVSDKYNELKDYLPEIESWSKRYHHHLDRLLKLKEIYDYLIELSDDDDEEENNKNSFSVDIDFNNPYCAKKHKNKFDGNYLAYSLFTKAEVNAVLGKE